MKNHTRKFRSDGVQHIYQRAKDKGVIFYGDIDRLLYFSIDSVMARRHNVTVLGSSIMFTHLHKNIIACKKEQMSSYIQDTTSVFARAYNYHHKREGSLFQARFGSASRTDEKKIRTSIAYQYNNHVEKGLCKHPEEERWCFLAYAKSDHPFSKPIDPDNISKPLKRAIRLIDRRAEKGQYLNYKLLEDIFSTLTPEETEQFIDHTISKYMFIDFDKAASYYNSLDAMISSFNDNTGSERAVREDYDNFSDLYYVKIGVIFKDNNWPHSKIFTSSPEVRQNLARALHYRRGINPLAAAKYLHI